MTKEAELLAFLTKKETLPFVIDILKRGDKIRGLLFNQFMTELKSYLEGNAIEGFKDWELTVVDELDDAWATLYCWNAKLRKENQYLRFAIEPWKGGGRCELVVCLEWANDQISSKPKVKNLKSLGQLHDCLKSQGFNRKGSTWTFRWQYIRKADSADEFLASILDEEKKVSLFRQICDCFWPVVRKTQKMVAAANMEIAKTGEKLSSEDDE